MKRIATNYGAFRLFKRTLILPIRLAIFSGMLLPFSRISSTPSKLWTLIWRKLLILLPRVIVVWSFWRFPFLKHFPKQLISVTLQQKLFVNVERLINYASRPFDKINRPSRPMVISDPFIIPQKCLKSKQLTPIWFHEKIQTEKIGRNESGCVCYGGSWCFRQCSWLFPGSIPKQNYKSTWSHSLWYKQKTDEQQVMVQWLTFLFLNVWRFESLFSHKICRVIIYYSLSVVFGIGKKGRKYCFF